MKKLITLLLCACLLAGCVPCLAEETAEAPYKTGDIVTYGKYYLYQDGLMYPVEWLVLEVKDDAAWLVSRYALDVQPFNKKGGGPRLTWANCSIRRWLNETFLPTAFSEEEQQAMIDMADDDTYTCKVGLVTRNAMRAWLPDEVACKPTEYAREVCRVETKNGICLWWTREFTPVPIGFATIPDYDTGKTYNQSLDNKKTGVRPLIKVDLKTVKLGTPSEEKPEGVAAGEDAAPALPALPKQGDIISFGSYYIKDAHTRSAISWGVMDVEDDAVLLISLYALDSQPYCYSNELDFSGASWATCNLRKWLNGMFRDEAFTAEEKKALKSMTVKNEDGSTSTDKIIVLSGEEAGAIFRNLQCAPTPYMKEAAGLKEDAVSCAWWTRTTGPLPGQARMFDADGKYDARDAVKSLGVRPVIAVDRAWFQEP